MTDIETTDEKEQWLFSIASKRVAWSLVKVVTSAKSTQILSHIGITIDGPVLENSVQLSVLAGLVYFHDWLKIKMGWKWL